MSNKRDLLDEIVKHEDAAYSIASDIEGGFAAPDHDTVAALARTVARLAQAVREAFEPINTSEFRR